LNPENEEAIIRRILEDEEMSGSDSDTRKKKRIEYIKSKNGEKRFLINVKWWR
jgi:hypothetical protein